MQWNQSETDDWGQSVQTSFFRKHQRIHTVHKRSTRLLIVLQKFFQTHAFDSFQTVKVHVYVNNFGNRDCVAIWSSFSSRCTHSCAFFIHALYSFMHYFIHALYSFLRRTYPSCVALIHHASHLSIHHVSHLSIMRYITRADRYKAPSFLHSYSLFCLVHIAWMHIFISLSSSQIALPA